jgi:hypothetical protein
VLQDPDSADKVYLKSHGAAFSMAIHRIRVIASCPSLASF